MMKKLTILLLTVVLISCNMVDDPSYYSFTGFAQKGPFVNGSNIVVYELNDKYNQTGKSFVSSTGVTGGFELNEIPLNSPYIGIVADGFYYNENSGTLSNERLSLKAIADISDKSSLNVNILTNLEYERVRYLVSKNNYTLAQAKNQAIHEILSIFSLDDSSTENAENLDIRNSSEGDSKLLAISLILQGNNSTNELSKLLADFVTDTKEDGMLNDTLIQSNLVGQAKSLNVEQIRQNLSEKYAELGLEFSHENNFEVYIKQFIETTSFKYSPPFKFPPSGIYGINFLNLDELEFIPRIDYSFAAVMPGSGELTIKMQTLEGGGVWYYQPMKKIGWNVSNFTANSQTFTSTENSQTIDLPIQFEGYGKASVNYHFNNSEEPSLTKIITWGVENNSEYIFPDDSPYGQSLLNTKDNALLKTDSTYTVGVRKTGSWQLHFSLSYSPDLSVTVAGGWGKYEFNAADNLLNFTLTGKNEGDDISEIQLRVSGIGEMNLSSTDLEISAGKLLNRTYQVVE